MPTIDDLRHLLADDVATVPESRDRVSGVHHRITVRRRQVTGAAALAVVVVVGVSVAVLPSLGRQGTSPRPPAVSVPGPTPTGTGPSLTADAPLPEYRLGGRLIAQGEGDQSRELTVPFTSNTRRVFFTVDCVLPEAEGHDKFLSMRVGTQDVGSISCDPARYFSGANTWRPPTSALSSVTPGRAASVTVAPDDYYPDGRMRIGVYESVPWQDYHFPPQPDPLPVLEPLGNLDGTTHASPLRLVTPDTQFPSNETDTTYVDPNGSSTFHLTIQHGLAIDAQTAAPGILTFTVGGKVVHRISSWDYEQNGFGAEVSLASLGIKAGDAVDLTVTAAHFPGPSWAVLLSDEDTLGGG